mgnify:CR=1 FL=1
MQPVRSGSRTGCNFGSGAASRFRANRGGLKYNAAMPEAAAQPFVTSPRPSGVASRAATQEPAKGWTWQATPNPTTEAGWTTTWPARPRYNAGREQNKLGSYYCWNRIYEPSTGRWTTPDPAASPWNNLWDYAAVFPSHFSDPMGTEPNSGDLHSYKYSFDCGQLSLTYQEHWRNRSSAYGEGFGRYSDNHTGPSLNWSFVPNGDCCCTQWKLYQFERVRELMFYEGANGQWVGWYWRGAALGEETERARYSDSEGPIAPGGPSVSNIGPFTGRGHWKVATLEKEGDPTVANGERGASGSVQHGDQPGYHGASEQQMRHAPRLYFEITVCAICADNCNCFGGCNTIRFSVGPGGTHMYDTEWHPKADHFNEHPARHAWNSSQNPGLPEAKDCS